MTKCKRVVLLPVYNEEKKIIEVLDGTSKYADIIIIVDDASEDNSKKLISNWMKGRNNAYLISLSQNRGQTTAMKKGYALIVHLLNEGKLDNNDIVINIDGDGQHDPQYIPGLIDHLLSKNCDIALTKRDFSNYPLYKQFGNRYLSFMASLLSNYRYNDLQSNFRAMRAKVIPDLMTYLIGYKYSGSFEIGVITALLNYRIDNDFGISVPFYRLGARFMDGLHVLFFGILTFFKVKFGIGNRTNSFIGKVLSEIVSGDSSVNHALTGKDDEIVIESNH